MSAVGKFFGISPKGSQMNAEDSAAEDKIQGALDKAYGTAGTFGQRKISADDAENALRAQGVLPAGWRLRESDSTSSGYRPTKAASKKMGALHAGEIAGAAFGGAGALGIGPLAAAGGAASGGATGITSGLNGAAGVSGFLSNPLVQGGIKTAVDAASGQKITPWSALNFAGALPGGSFAGGLTKNPLAQKAINLGVTTGLNTARTGQFNPMQAALGAGATFMPDLARTATGNPLTQRLTSFGGQQALNFAGGGKFNPLTTGLSGLNAVNPKVGSQVSGFLPHFAEGGDTPAGQPIVVGEQGAEVVIPKKDSTVIPNPNTTAPPTTPGAPAPATPNFWDSWGKPIATAGGIAGGMFAGRAAQNAAMKRSPEELAAIQGATGPNSGAATATSLMSESRPYISKPASYYQTLLNGNRAAMAQVTAPERAALNESYGGAQRGLAASGVRGAARDVLAGNLNRDKASKVAGLTTGVQPAAANALAGLGQGLQASAVPLYGQANSFYGQLLNNGLQNRAYAAKEGGDVGSSIGKMIADLGTTKFGKGGQPTAPDKKKPGAPGATPGTTPWQPPESTMPPEFPEEGEGEGGFGPPPPPPPIDEGDPLGGNYAWDEGY